MEEENIWRSLGRQCFDKGHKQTSIHISSQNKTEKEDLGFKFRAESRFSVGCSSATDILGFRVFYNREKGDFFRPSWVNVQIRKYQQTLGQEKQILNPPNNLSKELNAEWRGSSLQQDIHLVVDYSEENASLLVEVQKNISKSESGFQDIFHRGGPIVEVLDKPKEEWWGAEYMIDAGYLRLMGNSGDTVVYLTRWAKLIVPQHKTQISSLHPEFYLVLPGKLNLFIGDTQNLTFNCHWKDSLLKDRFVSDIRPRDCSKEIQHPSYFSYCLSFTYPERKTTNRGNKTFMFFRRFFGPKQSKKFSWVEAYSLCKATQGSLPTILDKDELHKLIALFKFSTYLPPVAAILLQF